MRVNKLIEELSTVVLAEFDSEVRFKTLALKGNKQADLDLLGKLDSSFMKASRQDSQLPNSPSQIPACGIAGNRGQVFYL